VDGNEIGEDGLSTRSVRLRSVRSSDGDWLYELLTCEAGARWRYRGRTPSPAEFAADLWRGVHTQFVACAADGGRPVGLVGIYNLNQGAGHCHLFAVGGEGGAPLVAEAAGLLVTWAFDHLDVRKIWIEAPEFNLAQFAGLTSIAAVEGRLEDFDFWRGRYWDLFILSVVRQRWDESMRPLVERRRPLAARGDPGAAGVLDPAHHQALEVLLGELLPLDSLGAIELLTALEEAAGTELGYEVVVDLPDGIDEAMGCIVRRLDRAQQSAGMVAGSPAIGQEPSRLATTQIS
jgi:RimJ/RimL family protein N-acetyltransferase